MVVVVIGARTYQLIRSSICVAGLPNRCGTAASSHWSISLQANVPTCSQERPEPGWNILELKRGRGLLIFGGGRLPQTYLPWVPRGTGQLRAIRGHLGPALGQRRESTTGPHPPILHLAPGGLLLLYSPGVCGGPGPQWACHRWPAAPSLLPSTSTLVL